MSITLTKITDRTRRYDVTIYDHEGHRVAATFTWARSRREAGSRILDGFLKSPDVWEGCTFQVR